MGITFSFDDRIYEDPLNQLLDKIIQRSAFPGIHDVDAELRKVAILRIITGVVIFVRFFEIVDTLILLKEPAWIVYFGLFFLGFVFLFTVGFFTNIAALAIVVSAIYFDDILGTSTLGTAVSVFLLIPFLLVNAGQEYSIDKWLIKKKARIFRPVKEVASLFGTRDPKLIVRYYFLGFILYATISFGALLLHIQDDFWLNGLTTKSLLLNSFLCKHYDWFRWIDGQFPGLLSVLSISATVLQSIFQFLMVGLIFFKTGRRFVFWWGMNFFIISFFFINLSYLPHVEIVYWLLVLSPAGTIGGDFLSKRFIGSREQRDRAENANEPFIRNVGLRKFLTDKVVGLYLIFIVGYFLFRSPYTSVITNWMPGIQKEANFILAYSGFDLPKVFNKTDLSMGDTWMELYRKDGEEWILTPLVGTDGERGSYSGFDVIHFTNHNSDILYFGTTLKFRRWVLYQDVGECLELEDRCGRGLRRLMRYDYLKCDLEGVVIYRIVVRSNKTSLVTHAKGDVHQYDPELVLEREYLFDGVEVEEVEI